MITETKMCRCCGEAKPVSSFRPRSLQCKPCVAVKAVAYRAENRDRRTKYNAEYNAANRDKVRATKREWTEKNLDTERLRTINWRANNRDKYIESQRASESRRKEKRKAYRSEKSSLYAAHCAARRAKHKSATVGWSDGFIVSEMYSLAKRRANATGVAWHVDHVVPLQSDLVCGLHSHTNMQVIPGSINIAKGNRTWPEMPS